MKFADTQRQAPFEFGSSPEDAGDELAPEPAYAHGTAPRTAVVLCNLGTPDAPTPAAVRRYLAEFLSDPRVVEIPRLRVVADPARHDPAHAAGAVGAQVRQHLDARGSPLKVWTEKQAMLLEGYLGQRGHRVVVRYAMRYGTPSIASGARRIQGGRRRRAS